MDIVSSINYIIDEVERLEYLNEGDGIYLTDILDEAKELKQFFASFGLLNLKQDLVNIKDTLERLEKSSKSRLTENEKIDLMLIQKDIIHSIGVLSD